MTKRLFFLTIAAFGAALPALAGITYTCDPSVPTNACTMMQGAQAAGVYNGIFSNASANIYVQFSGSGLAGSNTGLNSVSYSDYRNALISHVGDANDVTAVASLPLSEPAIYGGRDVAYTSALGSALGLTNSAGVDAATGLDCTLGSAGCYNGVITIGASANPLYYPASPSDPTAPGWDFFMLIEHETDEILGTISCIGDNGGATSDICADSSGNTFVSPADLFRYSAPHTLSWDFPAAPTTGAYFSNNAGVTNIADYNNVLNGGDFGDWVVAGCRVQGYSACQSANSDLTNDGGAEIAVLDAVGFNLVPEPGTMGLLAVSLAILALLSARRSRQN